VQILTLDLFNAADKSLLRTIICDFGSISQFCSTNPEDTVAAKSVKRSAKRAEKRSQEPQPSKAKKLSKRNKKMKPWATLLSVTEDAQIACF